MTDPLHVSGECLCGAVRLAARAKSQEMDACHCRMCRRWGGSPVMAVMIDGDVKFTGEEFISVFDSSEWAERGFCRRCGTHLFYRLKDQLHYGLPIGLLDAGPEWRFETEIFVEEQPDYYRFENNTRRMTGEEVFKEFGEP